jgi:hypothetical protein
MASARVAIRYGERPELDDLSGPDAAELHQEFRHERREIFDSVAPGAQNNDAESPVREKLLLWEPLVDGYERIAHWTQQIEQRPVVGICPSQLADRVNLVPGDVTPKRARDAVVQDDSHTLLSRGRGLAGERFLGEF